MLPVITEHGRQRRSPFPFHPLLHLPPDSPPSFVIVPTTAR